MLYFSGILVVAETAQRSYLEKIKILKTLLSMPVIDRITSVCGPRSLQALELYDHFLEQLSREEVRRSLDAVSEADRLSEPFRSLKDQGHHFTWKLMSLLRDTYDTSHPIHRALVL